MAKTLLKRSTTRRNYEIIIGIQLLFGVEYYQGEWIFCFGPFEFCTRVRDLHAQA